MGYETDENPKSITLPRVKWLERGGSSNETRSINMNGTTLYDIKPFPKYNIQDDIDCCAKKYKLGRYSDDPEISKLYPKNKNYIKPLSFIDRLKRMIWR